MHSPSLFARYGFAVLCVVLSTCVRYALGFVEPEVLFFSTYYPAVLVATLYAGRGPGILALLLSLSAAWLLFLPPYLHLAVPSRKTLLNLLLFTLSAGLLVWVADRYRAALEALRKSEERRSLLVDELQHRSKNTLAVAGALVSSTLAHDQKKAEQLISRLRLVLASDDIYRDADRSGVLNHLLLSELQAYGAEHFSLSGERIEINPRQSRDLALVFHELATNSAKYGALSVPHGFLTVRWEIVADQLTIDWKEEGRSPSGGQEAPASFGSRLIDAMVRDLRGTIERKRDDTSYFCRISFPLKCEK